MHVLVHHGVLLDDSLLQLANADWLVQVRIVRHAGHPPRRFDAQHGHARQHAGDPGLDSPANNGSPAITGYTVTGSPSGTCTTSSLTCTISGLTNATSYSFTVKATNANGAGPASNALSATPATVPGAPDLTGATAGNGQVILNWAAPASNGGSAITGYRIYRGTTPGGESATAIANLGVVLTYTDTGRTNGTRYYYKVSAVNGVGEGTQSGETSAVPATLPGAPTLATPTVGNVTTYQNTGLVNGTRYYYKVSAVNGIGEGPQSGETSGVPAAGTGVPAAPTLTAAPATGSKHGVQLSWTVPANNGSALASYRVYRSTASGAEVFLSTRNAGSHGWRDSSATPGVTYFYRISATNANGEGPLSNEAFATAN